MRPEGAERTGDTDGVVDSRFVGATDDFFGDDRVGDSVFFEKCGKVRLHRRVFPNISNGGVPLFYGGGVFLFCGEDGGDDLGREFVCRAVNGDGAEWIFRSGGTHGGNLAKDQRKGEWKTVSPGWRANADRGFQTMPELKAVSAGLWLIMKRSDTTMDTQTGKFVVGAKPLTTVTDDMVIKRAKEIAVINGRNGNDFTPGEYDQAKRELTGFPNTDAAEVEAQAPATGEWLGEAGDPGQRTPVRAAKDEQTFAEDLVKEGVEEATHHTMLAGSERSARKDQV